jgi:signal transduction histidine kinase
MRKATVLFILLLTAGAVALGVFAWREARRASGTEGLLMKDYASFVADNVMRFSTTQYLNDIGMYRHEQSLGKPTVLGTLRERIPALPVPTNPEVDYYFAFDARTKSLTTSGLSPVGIEREELITVLDKFDANCGPEQLTAVAAIRVAGQKADLPLTGLVQTDASRRVTAIYGARLNTNRSVEQSFKSVINTPNNCECGRTIFPASLASVVNSREGASFILRDRKGNIVLRTDPDYRMESAYAVTRTVATEMPFGGWTLEVAMNPAVVRPLLPYGGRGAPWLGLALAGVMVAGSSVLAVRALRRDSELLRLRQEFVSNVSHELKTPLSRIRLFNEILMLRKQPDAEKRSQYRSVIDRECRRLTLLLENILDFSRYERSARKLTREQLDLRRVTEDALEAFRAASDPSRFSVKATLEEVPLILGDAAALQQVVINLLDNAVKYSPAGSSVEVTLKTVGQAARLSVRDHGFGIPGGEQAKIFQEFYRVDNDDSQSAAGAGLGLALVKRTIQAHAGSVCVESEVGKGSSFVVDLPLAANV